MRMTGLRLSGTDSFPRGGPWRPLRRRRDQAVVLYVALVGALVGLTTALALCEVVVKTHASVEKRMRKSASFAAAIAGLEQAKLVLANSSIPTDHIPIAFSGALANEDYSVTVDWLTANQFSLVSTGVRGDAQTVLSRTMTYDRYADLRVVTYGRTYKTMGPITVISIFGHGVNQVDPLPETPDYNWWRNEAKKTPGHYYSTTSGTTFNKAKDALSGIYFFEGDVHILLHASLWKGTIVSMGNIEVNNLEKVASPSPTQPVLVAKGNIDLREGDVDGAVFCEGEFRIANGKLTGRITCGDFKGNNGLVSDGGNLAYYTLLNGFSYASATYIHRCVYSGWAESE